ncbi:MAG TPA: hypothetical protein VGC79_01110 [Polyangiaceae bacterium]
MTPDDAHTSHNHGFELPNAPNVVVDRDSRPWRALAGVAVCLGLAGLIAGLIIARRQSASDEHLTSDALQREELRDGWRALGAAAANDARANDQQAAATPSANAAAPPPNVVIVNVPPQNAPVATAAPASVTNNINVPSAPNAVAAPAGTDGSNANPGFVPIQSLPPINYSPVQGYVPTQAGYPAPPAIFAPQNGNGTTTGGVAPVAPVGNGSIPGSAPNPALPNNGLVGSTPLPSSPNGSANVGVTPSADTNPTPASPNTPTLPSGFSAP